MKKKISSNCKAAVEPTSEPTVETTMELAAKPIAEAAIENHANTGFATVCLRDGQRGEAEFPMTSRICISHTASVLLFP